MHKTFNYSRVSDRCVECKKLRLRILSFNEISHAPARSAQTQAEADTRAIHSKPSQLIKIRLTRQLPINTFPTQPVTSSSKARVFYY